MRGFLLPVKQYSCIREAILDSEVLVILNDFFSSPRTASNINTARGHESDRILAGRISS